MKVTTSDVQDLLRQKYGITQHSNEWALFFELRNGTGFGRQERYADAFAINLYPSNGFTRRAYEIKVSRSDFLKELSQPEKRQWAMSVSNEFWFICANGIAKKEEIPENCGLIEVTKKGDKLRTVVRAKYTDAKDFTMREVAAIARQSCDYKTLGSPYWKWMGKEIAEEDIYDLVQKQKDMYLQHQIERGVEKGVDKEVKVRLEFLIAKMKEYSTALRDAGVSPPSWMENNLEPVDYRWGDWNAESWVKNNVTPGPSAEMLDKAIADANDVVRHLEQLKKISN